MNQQKKRLEVKNPRLTPIIDIYDLDEKAVYLVGWPGYRTTIRKSGLGYIETQAEWAHMQGLMFRWMITGKFKTRNPIYLFCITVYGLFSVSPVLLLFAGADGRYALLQGWSVFLLSILVGMLLLANVVLSLIKCDEEESITGN